MVCMITTQECWAGIGWFALATVSYALVMAWLGWYTLPTSVAAYVFERVFFFGCGVFAVKRASK